VKFEAGVRTRRADGRPAFPPTPVASAWILTTERPTIPPDRRGPSRAARQGTSAPHPAIARRLLEVARDHRGSIELEDRGAAYVLVHLFDAEGAVSHEQLLFQV
jgi:hypothetical protein